MNNSTMNALGQPIGHALDHWHVPDRPPHTSMVGTSCTLEPLDPERHHQDLIEAYSRDREGRTWTYLGYGPFPSPEAYGRWMNDYCSRDDHITFAIIDGAAGAAAGIAAYLRITPDAGSVEVGNVVFSPNLRQTRAATEAMYLMMRNAFRLGYRRYEWKCDALNEASRAAALRLGFTFEGIFRQATVVKGRTRDTAWYSIIDREWPERERAFERWLAEDNFDASGRQRIALRAFQRDRTLNSTAP